MKRFRMLRTALVASIVAVMMIFAIASPAGAKSKPSIKVTPSSLLIGDTATVSGKGFKPRTQFVLRVNDAKFASGTTNRKGRVRFSFTIPAGAWQELNLKLTCAGRSATATVSVVDGEVNLNGSEGISADNGDVEDAPIDDPDDPDQPPEFSF